MPNRPQNYVDKEKYRKTCYEQRKRYYNKTAKHKWRHWTTEEDNAVLRHDIPDMELSKQIDRSVGAIQTRRGNLKKWQGLF